LEQDLEGLLHVSELTDRKVEDPHEEVQIGQEIEVKILRVDIHERKIGLSKKRADWAADTDETGAPKPRRGGLHGAGEETTDYISPTALLTELSLPPPPSSPPKKRSRRGQKGAKSEQPADQPPEAAAAEAPAEPAGEAPTAPTSEETETPTPPAAESNG